MADIDAEIELGDLSDLADGEMRCFENIGPDGIVVCRSGGALYALTDNCSHADTPLSEGRLRGFGLTCPLHGASFDVRDGSHSGPPAWEGVGCHQVTESDGVAVVVLAERSGGDDGPSADGSRMQSR
ncbi:MAG: Rieske 2Fe-2S domain-containing protein [Ilumatobacter sp.]|nr:Rieske 2Fe-2S domain-containing protein [bacterium]MDG1266814.1 Rieske 2Fe-2S domain-containing protein [Ilumatobacter sp.]NKB40716.1 Rieske 2Fe-2S domain-containing protein [Ilumatobacter sp.]